MNRAFSALISAGSSTLGRCPRLEIEFAPSTLKYAPKPGPAWLANAFGVASHLKAWPRPSGCVTGYGKPPRRFQSAVPLLGFQRAGQIPGVPKAGIPTGCNRLVTNLFLKKPALGAAFSFS